MKTIGFIGLGNLGLPIATNLLKAGYDLRVYNRTKEKSSSLAAMGAKAVSQASEAAVPGGIVITLVSDDAALRQIATDELAKTLGHGGMHISMSTIAADTSRSLADHHKKFGARRYMTYLRAPRCNDDVLTLCRFCRRVANIGDAIQSASEVVRYQHRSIRQIGHIHWASAVLPRFRI